MDLGRIVRPGRVGAKQKGRVFGPQEVSLAESRKRKLLALLPTKNTNGARKLLRRRGSIRGIKVQEE